MLLVKMLHCSTQMYLKKLSVFDETDKAHPVIMADRRLTDFRVEVYFGFDVCGFDSLVRLELQLLTFN